MSRLVATYEEQSAVTILLVLLSACSYSCKTLCPLTEAPLVPLLLLPLLSQQYLLMSIHLLLLPALSLPLLLQFVIPLHLHPLLCKGSLGTAQYAEDYDKTLKRKGSQTLTGHFHCALSPQESAHQGLIWLSHSLSLYAPAVPPPDLRPAAFSPLCLFPSRLCMGKCERLSVLEGQRVWELEGTVKIECISYQYRLFWRTRPPPIPRSAVRSEVWHPSSLKNT